MKDVRQTEDPLPIEIFELNQLHEDKRYLKVEITDWWGEPDEAGIDYFDIVRIDPTISKTSKMDCSEKSGDCAPLPQFCPTAQCISDKIWWTDKNYPGYYQKGCSIIGKDSPFEEKSRCVKKEAIKDLDPPYIIDTSDESLLDECTSWSDTEPCETELLTISEIPKKEILVADTFKLAKDDCSDGEFIIELINKDDGEPSGDFLSYLDSTNSTVGVGDDEKCFLIKLGLCGPDSITFTTPNDYFLTVCDGMILLKLEFDHCGYEKCQN